MDSKNKSDDSDDKFETQNSYDCESDSDNLDFFNRNYILLTFK